MNPSDYEQLSHYRRTVAEIYARARRSDLDERGRWLRFRRERDELFGSHPQSALSARQKSEFSGLNYFDYRPELRFNLQVIETVASETIEVELQKEGLMRLRRFGKVEFAVQGESVSLSLYWVIGYGGGIFLPFRDQTNGGETFGGGRYLLDTIKGADLGQEGGRLVVDFNYAYNPSCAYNPRWHCPLAPPENRLPVAIRAGELGYPGKTSQ